MPKPTNSNAPDLGAVPAHAQDFTASLLRDIPSPVAAEHTERYSLLAELPVAVPAGPRTIACMVTHGMGQQVPFQTVSMIGEAFVKGRTPRSVQANRVQLTPGADLLSRLELIYDADGSTPETHVHLYEGYWAPLTAGKITYVQSLSFLLCGAAAGLISSIRRKFDRWIFGTMYNLPVKRHTSLILLVVALVLLLGLLLAYLGGLEIAHFWTRLKQPLPPLSFTGLKAAAVHLLSTIMHGWRRILSTLILVILAFIYRYFLRLFIIDYLGSVAIYVSSYKVSAFQDVRETIQKTVFTVGSQIFQARVPGQELETAAPLYDQVLFIGHSLGTVITYDLINALIVWDSNSCSGQNNVLGRIHRLITFGSPLDKTAFLFRTQISPEHHYREVLAALQQPLVLDYHLRTFPWINLYSQADIVSGHLDYYDVPSPTPGHPHPLPPGYNPIQNRIDPAARIWVYAHIQYWVGKELRDLLQDAIR